MIEARCGRMIIDELMTIELDMDFPKGDDALRAWRALKLGHMT